MSAAAAAPATSYVEMVNGVETIKARGLITLDKQAGFKLAGGAVSPIQGGGGGKERFKSEGKKTWLLPLSVKYPSGESSSAVYSEGFAIDTKHWSPKMDFVYVGIPEFLVSKVIAEVATPRGIKVEAPISDGFLWVTCKLRGISKIFILSKPNIVERESVPMVTQMHDANINPVGLAVATMRLKCTVPEDMDEEDVVKQVWTIGASVALFYTVDDTPHTAPTKYGGKTPVGATLPKAARDVVLSDKLAAFVNGSGMGTHYEDDGGV